MGFDLMKLEEPYRSGRLIKKTEKSVELLSPVGRISFPKLSKPVAMELNLDSMMHAEPVLKRVRSDGLGWFTDPDGTGFDFD